MIMAAGQIESLSCCVPETGWELEVCSKQPILRQDLVRMCKVGCTSDSCPKSGFMHPECLYQLENEMIKLLNARLTQKDSIRKNHWHQDDYRQNLWKHPTYNILYRDMKCDCGKGMLKKDLNWPPISRKIKAKVGNAASKKSSERTTLNFKDKVPVHYVPSVRAEFPRPAGDSSQRESAIPGAVFADPKVIKRGEVVMFNGKWGQIKNLGSKEEKPTYFKNEVIVSLEKAADMKVGSEVEYQSEKKGKKHEAVMVKLVKSAEVVEQGVVSHWVPHQLAGVITCDNRQELLLSRKAFAPGGFSGDIVGKRVQFKMDSTRCEARCVEVLAGQNTDIGAFTNAELEQCWTLREAVKEDSVLAGAVAGLETGEQAALTTSLIPFLPRLAVHPVGWRVVVALAAAGTTETQHNLVNLLQSHFLQLAECGAGAACLLSCLACLPSPLLVRLGRAGCEVAARLTGPHSASWRNWDCAYSAPACRSCSTAATPASWTRCWTSSAGRPRRNSCRAGRIRPRPYRSGAAGCFDNTENL